MTPSVQRPHKIMSQRLQMTEISLQRPPKTTFQQRLHLPIFKSSPMRTCFLIESVLGENSTGSLMWNKDQIYGKLTIINPFGSTWGA